ncbi:MAG: nitroreductase family protein [Eubacteriaceae bacterium]|nr:nitroreductase family protein [Eubacteriaceae bacterium]
MGILSNEVLDQLRERKSVRVFTGREVSAEVKQALFASAAEAPTAGNQQLYTILDITDEELKKRLSVLCDNQAFIASAPVVLIFCADMLKWLDAYREAGLDPRPAGAGDLFISLDDALIAAQNVVTAAQSLGLGSCYIGDIMENCEAVREALCLPEMIFPAAMLVIGYPTPQQLNRTKPARFPMDSIVMQNTYKRRTGKELREMFRKDTEPAGKSFEEWIEAFCRRKYESGFSREMTRSVEKYLEDYRSRG